MGSCQGKFFMYIKVYKGFFNGKKKFIVSIFLEPLHEEATYYYVPQLDRSRLVLPGINIHFFQIYVLNIKFL